MNDNLWIILTQYVYTAPIGCLTLSLTFYTMYIATFGFSNAIATITTYVYLY